MFLELKKLGVVGYQMRNNFYYQDFKVFFQIDIFTWIIEEEEIVKQI